MIPLKLPNTCTKLGFKKLTLASIVFIGILALISAFSDAFKVKAILSTKKQLVNAYSHKFMYTTDVFSQTSSLQNVNENNYTTPNPLQSPTVVSLQNSTRAEYNKGFLKTFTTISPRKIVNPYNYRFIHNIARVCRGRDVELLVGVTTRAENFNGRNIIRETWGEYGKNPDHRTVVLFFLGRPKTLFYQGRIDQEAEQYGDIIQADFLDTYRNLTLKSMSLMKWVITYCPNALFILKSDDDMYINIPRLIKDMRAQLTRTRTFLMGRLYSKAGPMRDTDNKWFVPLEDYSDKYFPDYVSGSAYSLTTSAAKKIFNESQYMNFFFLEDVFLTGMVAQRADVPRINNFKFNPLKTDPNGCNYKHRISGHRNLPVEIKKIHQELYDPHITCYFND